MTPDAAAAAAYGMVVDYLSSGQIEGCTVTPSFSIYQRNLPYGASAGASIAGGYIERLFDATPTFALAPVTLEADLKTFTLGQGFWRIEARGKSLTAGWSFMDISPAGGTPPVAIGPLAANAYDYLSVVGFAWVTTTAPIRIRQWYQNAYASGQGYGWFASPVPNVVAEVVFTRWSQYPG